MQKIADEEDGEDEVTTAAEAQRRLEARKERV
jgi:hypothetical protein